MMNDLKPCPLSRICDLIHSQCIKTLMDCDGVAMLADWRASNGACTEVRVAQDVGMECKTVGAWVKAVNHGTARTHD